MSARAGQLPWSQYSVMIASARYCLLSSFPLDGGMPARTRPQPEDLDIGTALGPGILLDATVVQALLVPAVVSLLGRAAWWLPGRRPPTSPARPALQSIRIRPAEETKR
jgi:MMPL family